MATPTFVSTKMFVVNEDGELLVLTRSKTDDRRPGQLDLPGGWVEAGEEVMAAAIRETVEEAGIAVDSCKLVYALSESVGEKGCGTWVVFLARVQGRPAVTLSEEHDAADWIPLQDAPAKFKYDRQIRMLRYVIDNGIA